MTTYDNFLGTLKEKWNVVELSESPLLRNDTNYFTFSPFLDTESNFKTLAKSNDIYVKYQRTIRKINALNLTNPLNMNFQVTYSVQRYKRLNQLTFINELIESIRGAFFPEISKDDIEITYPDILHSYFLQTRSPFTLNEVKTTDRYRCKLDIPGSHIYIKVRMKYKTGSINVVDFVLVDYQKEDFLSQLDSIWVEDLIDLLRENQRFIFDENKYSEEKNVVSRYTTDPRDQHIIINDIRIVLKLISLGVIPGSKGINSEVKRKIRKLYFYYYFYVSFNSIELINIIQDIGLCEQYSDSVIDLFIKNIQQTESNYKKAVKTLKKKKMNREEAQSSLGIPNEYYGDFLQNWHSEYDF